MKLASAVAANELVFEIDEPSQGLIFSDGLKLGTTIKVDLITSNANDVNRIPEIPITDLFEINAYLGLDHTQNYDRTASVFVNAPLVFFSASGVLPFDDDTKYKVTLSNLGAATFDVFNMDNSKLGVPMVIKKAEVKSTQAERTEMYKNIDLLYFNGGTEPTKMTYLVDDITADGAKRVRKVDISIEQMNAYKNAFEASYYEVTDQQYSNGMQFIGFPIDQLEAVTLHHDTSEGEDLKYLTVDYK